MRIGFVSVLSCVALAGCATNPRVMPEFVNADAGPVLAAEAALLADARERGVWQAFEAALADDAVLFIPHAIAGKDRAKTTNATNPRQWAWNTHAVTMSCDRSIALVEGEVVTGQDFQADYFSIWERDAAGSYELAADAAFYQGDGPEIGDYETIGEAREMDVSQGGVLARSVICDGTSGTGAATKGSTRYSGVAADGSMRWTLMEKSNGASQLVVEGRQGTGYRAVLDHGFPAPPER